LLWSLIFYFVAFKVVIEGDPEEEIRVRKNASLAEILGEVSVAKPVVDCVVFILREKPEKLTEWVRVRFGKKTTAAKVAITFNSQTWDGRKLRLEIETISRTPLDQV
jgi:hypothetical protein